MLRERNLRLFAASAFAIWMPACGAQKEPISNAKSIVGDSNDLVPVDEARLLAQVGVLSISSSKCTAFVSGKNQITSAAHCMTSEQLKDLSTIKFTTADGQMAHVTAVAVFDVQKDYMVLNIDKTFSDSLPLGGWKGGSLTLVGYDVDHERLMSHTGCMLQDAIAKAGVFAHSCDSIAGMSGSPVLEDGVVVGVHLGQSSDGSKNYAFETSLLGRDDTDVKFVGLISEWKIKIPSVRNPISGAQTGAVVGALAGGPVGTVIGSAVGAVIGDKIRTRNEIDKLRREGREREAKLLELKAKLDEAGKQLEQKKNELSCEKARSGFLPGLEAMYNAFKVNIENCADEAACNNAWNSHKTTTEAMYTAARGVCR